MQAFDLEKLGKVVDSTDKSLNLLTAGGFSSLCSCELKDLR
jgi:hypothetical protein